MFFSLHNVLAEVFYIILHKLKITNCEWHTTKKLLQLIPPFAPGLPHFFPRLNLITTPGVEFHQFELLSH